MPDRSFRSRGKIKFLAGFPNGLFLLPGSGGLANNCRGLQLASYKSQRLVAGFVLGPGSNSDAAMAGASRNKIANVNTAKYLNTLPFIIFRGPSKTEHRQLPKSSVRRPYKRPRHFSAAEPQEISRRRENCSSRPAVILTGLHGGGGRRVPPGLWRHSPSAAGRRPIALRHGLHRYRAACSHQNWKGLQSGAWPSSSARRGAGTETIPYSPRERAWFNT